MGNVCDSPAGERSEEEPAAALTLTPIREHFGVVAEGVDLSEASDAQLRAQPRLWLSLTEGAGGAKPSEEGLRLRLAALAACGIASARQSTELQLPRLLYTGRS